LRLSITNTAPGGQVFHRLALRVLAVVEDADRVQVLARRHVAQREGRPHHVRQAGVQRPHVLDELLAQAALEQRGAQRGGADLHQLAAGVGVHRRLVGQKMSGSGTAAPKLVSRKSKSQPWSACRTCWLKIAAVAALEARWRRRSRRRGGARVRRRSP
jgi:hypothetical protein